MPVTAYGLLLKNLAEEVQVDATYKNYSVRESGSLTLNNRDIYGMIVKDIVDFSLTTGAPLSFITLDGQWAANTAGYYYSTGISKFASAYFVSDWGSDDSTIDWAMLTEGRNKEDELYGLQVFSPTGGEVFNSADAWLKIVSVNTTTITQATFEANTCLAQITGITNINNYFALVPCWNYRYTSSFFAAGQWTYKVYYPVMLKVVPEAGDNYIEIRKSQVFEKIIGSDEGTGVVWGTDTFILIEAELIV